MEVTMPKKKQAAPYTEAFRESGDRNPWTVYLFYYQTLCELTNEYTVPGFPAN